MARRTARVFIAPVFQGRPMRHAGAGRHPGIGFPAPMRFYEFESRRIVERAGIPVTEYGFCKTAARPARPPSGSAGRR